MITVRTIGYHENAPKIASIGSRNSSVVRPPPRTHVTGVRRARRRAAGLVIAWAGGAAATVVTSSATAIERSPCGVPPAGGRSDTRPMVRRSGAGGDRLLGGLLRLLEQLRDFRVLRRQHRLDGRVERVVDRLRR